MRRLSIHNALGDTIVEVLVVLAVLGLAFSISYATATHATIQSRNAEEHSEALGILKSQVDLARAAVAQGVDPATLNQSFCIPDPANPQTVVQFPTVPASDATDNSANYPTYPAGCVSTFYHSSGTYNSSSNTIDFRVRWSGLGSLGAQQEELVYRIFKLVPGNPGIVLGSSPPQIKVVVRAISSGSSCASPLIIAGGSGVPVSVNQTDGSYSSSTTTDASDTAAFQNLTQGGHYTASITSPVGYTPCSTSQSVVIGTANTTAIDFYLKSDRVPLYRYYGFNTLSGNPQICTDHFYTTNLGELGFQAAIPGAGPPQCYNYEGVVGYVLNTQLPGSLPFYRLRNDTIVDHFYTLSAAEATAAVSSSGYILEGIAGYMYPSDGSNCTTYPATTPFQRYYSGYIGDHVYVTGSENPNNYAATDGGGTFTYEGIAGCIFTAP